MKKSSLLFFASFLTFAVFSGCEKSKSPDTDAAKTDDLLTDPSTAWKRVAIIPFDGLGSGATPYNAMKGFDLQKVGGQFAVLYTQHSLDPVVHSSSDYFYKTLVSENATAANLEKISFGIFSGGGNSSPFTYYAQFLPNSYSPVFTGMDYTSNYIELRDKEGDIYAGAPASNYPTFKYLADGEFLASSTWLGHESFLWHYKNPPNPIGDFSSTYRPGIIDGNNRLFNIPIKTSDGSYYEFSLCSKNNAVTFLTIRCREDRAYGTNPANYEIVDSGPVANLPQSGFPANSIELLTYDYNSSTGEITFVFNDRTEVSNIPKNIYCYRWKQGSLTKLWQTSLDSDPDFRNAIQVFINKNMLNEWRLKPDGTFYLMCSSSDLNADNSGPGLKLWEVNGSGIKLLSFLTEAQTGQKSFTLSTCRYIDGSYYALAYPTGDGIYKIGDPRYHMEIVKLNP